MTLSLFWHYQKNDSIFAICNKIKYFIQLKIQKIITQFDLFLGCAIRTLIIYFIIHNPHFAVKWYSFLGKIAGKHAYSIITSQRDYSDNGRLVLKVIEIYPTLNCHSIIKILHLNQNCDYWGLFFTSYGLPAKLLGLSWNFKSTGFF